MIISKCLAINNTSAALIVFYTVLSTPEHTLQEDHYRHPSLHQHIFLMDTVGYKRLMSRLGAQPCIQVLRQWCKPISNSTTDQCPSPRRSDTSEESSARRVLELAEDKAHVVRELNRYEAAGNTGMINIDLFWSVSDLFTDLYSVMLTTEYFQVT